MSSPCITTSKATAKSTCWTNLGFITRSIVSFKLIVLGSALVAWPAFAQDSDNEGVHTPAPGSAERKAILESLHAEYTTGSGSEVKFQVKHFKVHDGWAWINVVPLDKQGEAEGDEWPSLLHHQKGKWTLIDLMAIASDLDDPIGPMDPSPKFLKEIKKRYPGVPNDIFPKKSD